MASQIEGRISSAPKAHKNGDFRSLCFASNVYDVSPPTQKRDTKVCLHRVKFCQSQASLQSLKRNFLLDETVPSSSTISDAAGYWSRIRQSHTQIYTARASSTCRRGWDTKLYRPQSTDQKYIKLHVQLSEGLQRGSEGRNKFSWLMYHIAREYSVTVANIYKFDKTGFQIGVISTFKVFKSFERKGTPSSIQLSIMGWITIIRGLNAKG